MEKTIVDLRKESDKLILWQSFIKDKVAYIRFAHDTDVDILINSKVTMDKMFELVKELKRLFDEHCQEEVQSEGKGL